MIQNTTAALMEQYGQDIEVLRAEETVSARAFLQPMLTNRKQEQHLPTPLGVRREDCFLYLGEAAVEVKAGRDKVRWEDKVFLVQSAHPIRVGKEISHWWAVLVPADKEAA